MKPGGEVPRFPILVTSLISYIHSSEKRHLFRVNQSSGDTDKAGLPYVPIFCKVIFNISNNLHDNLMNLY